MHSECFRDSELIPRVVAPEGLRRDNIRKAHLLYEKKGKRIKKSKGELGEHRRPFSEGKVQPLDLAPEKKER